MKLAFLGGNIPQLLPSLLADAFFACRQAADIYIVERNPAMADLSARYGEAVAQKSGLSAHVTAVPELDTALAGADGVIFADAFQAASRLDMDKEALTGSDKEKGLQDQARLLGGIGGLMQTLRTGSLALPVIEKIKALCPKAVVCVLSEPVGTAAALFASAGIRAHGLHTAPLRGRNGVEGLNHALHQGNVQAVMAGLPHLTWLCGLTTSGGSDLMAAARAQAEKCAFGVLCQRWLGWYGAIPMGELNAAAGYLPPQADTEPYRKLPFEELVEVRKERILLMNQAARGRLATGESSQAQMALLTAAPAVRPVQLLVGLLANRSFAFSAVVQPNNGQLPALPNDAMIEAPLRLGGPAAIYALPEGVVSLLAQVEAAERLAAQAVYGNRGALRDYAETAPSLSGLDRLYCLDVIHRLIELHAEVLPAYREEE